MKYRKWSLAEWSDFAQRARDVRDRLDDLIRTFPETPGLTTKHINAFIKAIHLLNAAMIRSEGALVRQHPDQDSAAIRFVHGQGSCFWGPCKGRISKGAPALSRAEWIALGNRIKAIRLDAQALGMTFQETANKEYTRKFFRAADAIGTAKFLLDSLVVRQHPDWPEATRVFYGEPLAIGSPRP